MSLASVYKRKRTELLGLTFQLRPRTGGHLGQHYAKGLHAWFLHGIQKIDPELSASLHDGQGKKAFCLSRLWMEGHGLSLRLDPKVDCRWSLHCLSQEAVDGVLHWLAVQQPQVLSLREFELDIVKIDVSLPAYTYGGLWRKDVVDQVALQFISPTAFRRRGQHFPLPLPRNVFQSYLRRWNHFSGRSPQADDFLDWVDEFVVVQQHHIETRRVAAGKRGLLTGFVGSVVFRVSPQGTEFTDYVHLFSALGHLAPYCGTGHKTTFGLGQTVLGRDKTVPRLAMDGLAEQLLLERVAHLQEIFLGQRQRQGGDRAKKTAALWAMILARRERGDRLEAIAADLEIPYETAKSYGKLARRSLRESGH